MSIVKAVPPVKYGSRMPELLGILEAAAEPMTAKQLCRELNLGSVHEYLKRGLSTGRIKLAGHVVVITGDGPRKVMAYSRGATP